MALFKKAENQQGYLKMSLMGFPGSGKTFTASEVAIGLVQMLKDKRPVFALEVVVSAFPGRRNHVGLRLRFFHGFRQAFRCRNPICIHYSLRRSAAM